MLPSMISYAQNYEDVALRRAFRNQEIGFYVDVGAAHPYYDSVTNWFYSIGWSGINIEPINDWFNELQIHRPRDKNFNVAIGLTKGEQIFYQISNHGLSTLNEEAARAATAQGYTVEERVVKVRTLSDIITEFCPHEIDFLKVDAEGAEEEVLRGANWTDFRPRVVLVEATRPNTQQSVHETWESVLTDAGYEFAWFDCLNRFYVRSGEPIVKDALSRPPSYFDNFQLARAVDIEARLEEALRAEAVREEKLAELEAGLRRARESEQALTKRLEERSEELTSTDRELAHIRKSRSYRIARWLAHPLKRAKR
jgi:FkbM family methyltransferase